MESFTLEMVTRSSDETMAVGARLGALLIPGDVVAMSGDLGAGKTCLVKGMAQGLGVPEESCVRSPTFMILNIHAGQIPLYHLDLYRIEAPEEMEELGYEEFICGDGVTAVEWADKMPGFLPDEALWVDIAFLAETERKLTFRGKGEGYGRRLERFKGILFESGGIS